MGLGRTGKMFTIEHTGVVLILYVLKKVYSRIWKIQNSLKKRAILRPLGNIVYFMPPYIIKREEIDKMLDIFNESLREYLETIK